jgi:hypothetical protein
VRANKLKLGSPKERKTQTEYKIRELEATKISVKYEIKKALCALNKKEVIGKLYLVREIT